MTHAVSLEGESAAPTAVTRRSFDWFGLIALVAIISAQALGALTSPPDRDMGHLQKIMYVHVPSAWNAFIAFFVTCLVSLDVGGNWPLYLGGVAATVTIAAIVYGIYRLNLR